jgi:hypothetical protein
MESLFAHVRSIHCENWGAFPPSETRIFHLSKLTFVSDGLFAWESRDVITISDTEFCVYLPDKLAFIAILPSILASVSFRLDFCSLWSWYPDISTLDWNLHDLEILLNINSLCFRWADLGLPLVTIWLLESVSIDHLIDKFRVLQKEAMRAEKSQSGGFFNRSRSSG